MSVTVGIAEHSGPTPSDEATRATAVDAQTRISLCRQNIDDIDAKISFLLSRRIEFSAQIQTLRLDSGGTRLSVARETEIVQRYASALGQTGAEIAQLVLKLCRGSAKRAG